MLWAVGCATLVLIPLVVIASVMVVRAVNSQSDHRLALAEATLEKALLAHAPDSGLKAILDDSSTLGTTAGFQYWQTAGQLTVTTESLRAWPFEATPIGFADVSRPSGNWRVYTAIVKAGGFLRVAEPLALRRAEIRELLLPEAVLVLVALPLIALVIAITTRRGLAPLDAIASRLERRSVDVRGPVDAHDVPLEATALVAALNGLLHRNARRLDTEQSFFANAVGELKTPLTILQMTLDHVDSAREIERTSLRSLRSSSAGLGRAIERIVDLTRADTLTLTGQMAFIDVEACIEHEVAQLAPIFEALGIPSVNHFSHESAILLVWESGLRLAVRRLIEGAIRFASPTGVVRIETQVSEAGFAVSIVGERGIEDDGGDSARSSDDLEFGLSVVQRVAEIHNAKVTLSEVSRSRKGVTFTFPDRDTEGNVALALRSRPS